MAGEYGRNWRTSAKDPLPAIEAFRVGALTPFLRPSNTSCGLFI